MMDEFEAFLKTEGFSERLIGEAAGRLEVYMDGILKWNKKVNLTAITSRDEFVRKHLLDSVMCCGAEEISSAGTVIDVGTGGGFPGIPLAAIFPEKQFVLLDSLGKRIKVIKEISGAAGIVNTEFIHARAEDLAREKKYREKFDLCVSRAVAGMPVLAEYCLPFVRRGGTFLAFKGRDCSSEMAEAENAISILGGRILRGEDHGSMGYGIEHTYIYIRKEKSTPVRYPRRAGTPEKEPLK